MIPPGHQSNFETLCRAVREHSVALMECIEAATGKPAYVICMVNHTDEGYEFVPVGKLFDDNPYREFVPPKLDDEPESKQFDDVPF